MVLHDLVHPDVLFLADLLRAEWPTVSERIRLSGHPTCEGDDDATDDDATDDDKGADDTDASAAGDDSDDSDDDKVTPDDDWQTKSRKNETRAKKAEREAQRAAKERDDLKTRLDKIEKANLSEQEKKIRQAREEAVAEVTTKYEAQQRADRIENAVTKLSLKGFKGKDDDGKDITLRFADPDDAQLRLDRALRTDELAYDDIYSGGKVNAEAVTSFLTELLEEHPRLRAPDGNGHKKDPVDFDGGKGKGGGARDIASMSPDDHLKEIQNR